MGKFTNTWLTRSKIEDGIYGDGDRLYLRVQGVAKSWSFIYTDPAKRRRELGLGGYPSVSLASARKLAEMARDQIALGIDPIEAKKTKEAAARAATKTLTDVCLEYIDAKIEPVSTAATTDRYRGYVANHLGRFGSKRIGTIGVAEIETILKPRWSTPTGPYLRSFLERVLDYAMVKKYVPHGLNVARYNGHLEHILATVKRGHVAHAAMSWTEVPAQMKRLQDSNDLAAPALRFTILCALRQGEARELRWCDVKSDRIVIPAERYKTRREHVVPLSPQAQSIIADMRGLADDLVFPGEKKGRPLSQHRFAAMVPDEVSIHGFRTSFVVWCVESGGFTDELAQRCLGHVIGTATTRAYQRSDFFEQKRAAFDAWAMFCG